MTDMFDRRSILGASAGLATGLTGLPALEIGTPASAQEPLDLNDPVAKMRASIKMRGTLEDGMTMHRVSRGWVYGYDAGSDTFAPFYSMINYNVTKWEQLDETTHTYRMYECALYTKFDEWEKLETFENQFTGDTVEPMTYLIGPIDVTVTPEGSDTGPEATIKPVSMDWTVMGGTVWVPVQSEFSFPNPISPEKWPKESSGPTVKWHSFILFQASQIDLENADLKSVRALNHYQENVTWAPWLEMAGRPGFSLSRGFGMKFLSMEEIPPEPLGLLVEHVPEMFDLNSWTGVRNNYRDFMTARKPKPV
jgi:hypothetical protein